MTTNPTAGSMPHPGVHYPPPLIYVAGLAAGWYLSRWRPWPMASPESWIPAAGATLFILVWLAIFVIAITTFLRAKTTMMPNRPAAALVVAGPYRFTRNPMYVSLAALYAGITCILNTWWPLILLPLVIATVDRAVIAREERYLSSVFPGEYASYAARVRRWL